MSTVMDPVESLRPRIGQEIGVSPWCVLDQAAVDAFGELTDDRDPVHNDPEWAKSGLYGGTIVQGFFVLSLLGKFLREVGLPSPTTDTHIWLNYGLDRVRFIEPLPVGKRVRDRVVLQEIRQKGRDSYVLKTLHTIEAESGEKPYMVAELLTMSVSH